MDFHVTNVVWGEEYTDLFLNISLPTQLAPGNLPSFSQKGKSAIYKIFTTEKDGEVIKKSPVFAELSSVMPTEIISIDNFDLSDEQKYGEGNVEKYYVVIDCYQQVVKDCIKDNAKFLFLTPDFVFPDGLFANLIEIDEKEGKPVVMTHSYRALRKSFVSAVKEKFDNNNCLRVSIPVRDVIKFSLKHLHPYSEALFWDAENYNHFPSHIYWRVRDGILARCFDMHPLMLKPTANKKAVLSGTVDGKYWQQICPSLEDVYVPKDSDEMVLIELSSIKHQSTVGIITARKSNTLEVAKWAISRWNNNSSLYGDLLKKRIRVHGEDINEEEWKKVEEESDRVIAEIDDFWSHGLKKEGRFEEAIAIEQQAFELRKKFPKNEGSYFKKGNQFKRKGRLEEAIAYYSKAIDKNFNFYCYHHKMGEALAKQGRWDEAVNAYKRAIELNPKSGCSYYDLGEALTKLGKSQEAMSCYEKAVEMGIEMAKLQLKTK